MGFRVRTPFELNLLVVTFREEGLLGHIVIHCTLYIRYLDIEGHFDFGVNKLRRIVAVIDAQLLAVVFGFGPEKLIHPLLARNGF